MSCDTIIVRTDTPELETSEKEALLTQLIEEHSLPRDTWTRAGLQEWAFGRQAQSLFAEYAACFLVPRLQHPGRQDPSLVLPTAHTIIACSPLLQAHHVLGSSSSSSSSSSDDNNNNTLSWTPTDYALRFCFALVHTSDCRRRHNPLVDPPPSKRARLDRADLYRAASVDAELRKLGRARPPPSEAALMTAAMRVLKLFVAEWRASSPEYAAFKALPERESPLSPVSSS